VVIVSANGGQIDGSVQNEKSEPAAGATVVLIPEASRRTSNYLYKRVGTDQNGHFTIKGVKPGEYKVFAWEEVENGAYQDPDFLKPLESKGEALSIKENAHESVQVKVIPVEK
jgi:Carboxypeptidase regulatory-like domain